MNFFFRLKIILKHLFLKTSVKNKIAFYINEEYILDHYYNVLKKLESNHFEIILPDKFKKKQYQNFINKLKSNLWNIVFLSEVLYLHRYKVFVTHLYLGGNTSLSENFIVKIKYYIYLSIKKIGINLKKKPKEQYFQKKLGLYNIKFFYGADNGNTLGGPNFEQYNEVFDEFFTHGPRDSLIIKKYFQGKIFEMGYPRYDSYFINQKNKELKKKILKKNLCNINKPTILWICTVSRFFSTILTYEKYMKKLTEEYNIILRPHPLEIDINQDRYNQRVFDIVKSKKFIVSDIASQKMSDLYLISDYVFCDYGGSIFSSVYLNKNILLMNNKNFSDEKSLHQTSVIEIRNYLPSINEDEGYNLKNIIKFTLNFKKNRTRVQKARKIYFGNKIDQNCSELVAHRLRKCLKEIKNEYI